MTRWNDTDTPLAYLITARTYGTWLHGDERGSVDRFMNKYGTPRIPRCDHRHEYNQGIMKSPPVILGSAQRLAVEEAVREVCVYRQWSLLAIKCAHEPFSYGRGNARLETGQGSKCIQGICHQKDARIGLLFSIALSLGRQRK